MRTKDDYLHDKKHLAFIQHEMDDECRVRIRRKFLAQHGTVMLFESESEDSWRKYGIATLKGRRYDWCFDRIGAEDVNWMSFNYWDHSRYAFCVLDPYLAFEFKIAVG